MHSKSALLKSLLRLVKTGSASALTLPQVFLLLVLPASFSTSFWAAGRADIANVGQMEKMFHSSRVKLPLVSMSASLFWGQCI